jgi:hypothetical protein
LRIVPFQSHGYFILRLLDILPSWTNQKQRILNPYLFQTISLSDLPHSIELIQLLDEKETTSENSPPQNQISGASQEIN